MTRTQRIAIWVATLIGLLVAWKVFGQGFGSFNHDLPYLVPPVVVQSNPMYNGLAYRWVSDDLNTNIPVATWTDRVAGLSLKNDDLSTQPLVSTNGVYIDDSHWLTNEPMMVSSNIALGLIVKFIDASPGGIYPGIIMNGYPNDDQYNYGYDFHTTDSSDHEMSLQRSSSFIALSADPYPIVSVYHDIIYTQVVTNNDTCGYFFYTNGVLSKQSSGSFLGYGWGGQSIGPPNMPITLGRNISRNSGPKMYVLEYWVWTNSPPGAANGNNLPANTISNWHYYATNTYHFSP